jgi:hypothetical protein
MGGQGHRFLKWPSHIIKVDVVLQIKFKTVRKYTKKSISRSNRSKDIKKKIWIAELERDCPIANTNIPKNIEDIGLI